MQVSYHGVYEALDSIACKVEMVAHILDYRIEVHSHPEG